MESPVKKMDEKIAMETLFSNYNKRIGDMEAERMCAVDEAFQIIRERMNKAEQTAGQMEPA